MTLTHSSRPTILRQDARGRIRFSREHKAAILAEFTQSGMTGIAFAAHVGVKYPTFAGWLRHERINCNRPSVNLGAPAGAGPRMYPHKVTLRLLWTVMQPPANHGLDSSLDQWRFGSCNHRIARSAARRSGEGPSWLRSISSIECLSTRPTWTR